MNDKYIYVIDWLTNLNGEKESVGVSAYTQEYMESEEALDRFFDGDVELRDRALGGEGFITYGSKTSEDIDNLNGYIASLVRIEIEH